MRIFPFWHVRWTYALIRHSFAILRGEHSWESSENQLKLLASKYNVNWHRFE